MLAPLAPIAFMMKIQESLDPHHVSLLGLPEIVHRTKQISHLVKEFG